MYKTVFKACFHYLKVIEKKHKIAILVVLLLAILLNYYKSTSEF